MKVYLDTCTLNRPLDDKAQLRVALEAEAVLGVLTRIEEGALALVASDILALEVKRSSQPERKAFVEAILEAATEFVSLDDVVRDRGKELESEDFGLSTPCIWPARNHRKPTSSARVMTEF